jgi:hypothetical protein
VFVDSLQKQEAAEAQGQPERRNAQGRFRKAWSGNPADRFEKGKLGNPAGRPPGSRNKATAAPVGRQPSQPVGPWP